MVATVNRPASGKPGSAPASGEGVFTGAETHGLALVQQSKVAVTSDGLGWRSAYVSRQRIAPHQRSFAPCAHPLIAFALKGPVPVWRKVHGVSARKVVLPGSFGIIPGNAAFEAKLDVASESLHVYVRQDLIDEMAAELREGEPEAREILPRFGAFDPVLEQLAMGLYEAAREPPPSSALYADHLARAIAARLVQYHSNAASKSVRPVAEGGLSPRDLKTVREFVEAKLTTQLSLEDLARETNLSPGHFSRLFKQSLGLSPHQYVLRSRIERAQRLLAETAKPVSVIAYECGFADQMHLTKVFRRLTGSTPAAFRKGNLPGDAD